MAFFRSGPFSPLVILATVILVFYQIIGSNGSSQFKASIVEIAPTSPKQGANITRKQAVDLMLENIDVYKEKAQQAARSRNDIIVFPEYGLFGIFGYDKYARRSYIAPFLETIPDPQKRLWNPCEDRYPTYPTTEIQRELSCMAKKLGLYVVANVGEKVPCKKRDDSNCPNDGQYQYNTNVVYSSNGTLVAKYRKKHLFKEGHYNSPDKAEAVTFRTHFGNFGLITSYDSLFKSPLVDLVNKDFTNIVMPNAWKTSKPLFRAIQWNSALARGQQINLFVSTVHDGHCGSYGSGIYTPYGMKEFVSKPNNSSAKFLSASIKSLQRDNGRPSSRPVLAPHQNKTTNYRMAVFNDEVTFKFLEFTKQRDNITVCHDRFCCQLNYDSSERIEKYALGVYKGHVRAVGYLLGVEMCVVVRCFPKCGQPIQRASTSFRTFELVGINFTTRYIYPQVLFESDQEVELLPYNWDYENGKIMFNKRADEAVRSASLMGRVYKEDKEYSDRRSGSGSPGNHAHVGQCFSVFITIVAFIVSIIFSS